MDFLAENVIPPTGHYLQLLQFLAVMVFAFHLPYVGTVIGSTAAAMWFTFSDRDKANPIFARLAGDLIDTFLGKKLVMFVLGVFPLTVLPIIYGQWFVGAEATPVHYIPMSILPAMLGFVVLVMYRRSFRTRHLDFKKHMMLGIFGLILLMSAYFVLLGCVVRLMDPEKWFRVTNLGIMLLNWNVIWKFALFIHLAFAVTGAAILFFFFSWSSRRLTEDDDYARFVRRFGAGLSLAFALAIPVFNLFFIYTAPDVAFDGVVYLLAALMAFVSMVSVFFLFAILRAKRPRFSSVAFVLMVFVFILSSTIDLRTMGTANKEHAALATMAAEEEKAAREAEIEQLLHAGVAAGHGEQVFKSVCSACHRFDTRLVGPPLDTVLPKYRDDVAALRAFIKAPSKKDPEYPPMPAPGISDTDIEAVADYLLEQLQERTGEGNQ